jgi:hypothetical protein
MRAFASSTILFALVACEAVDPQGGAPLDPAATYELTLPARHASSHEVQVFAELDGERAVERTELSFGLAEGYPRRVELVPASGLVLGPACLTSPGAVVWRSIGDVQGAAAGLELDGGALVVELQEEGTVTALLEGVIADQQCSFGDEAEVALRHEVVLRVHRVTGYVVEQIHQGVADCDQSVVLPADAPLHAPTARPLDAEGLPFAALNAPEPVSITLRSDAALTQHGEGAALWAEPGAVSVSVDTTLPVRGLESFVVVGPDSLTAVEAALYLRKAAAKGSVTERIADGAAYRLFFPESVNKVDVQVDSAMTSHGRLCAEVPAAWFASSSATPGRCEADAGSPDKLAGAGIPVATIVDVGECRLEVTIPGTSHAWATYFTTTL